MPVLDLLSIAVLIVVVAVGLSLLIVQLVTGVPPQSSSGREAADVIALLKEAGLPEQAVVYDLGSGWGSLVIELARAFPEAQIRGVEMSPFPYWVARFRTRNLSNMARNPRELQTTRRDGPLLLARARKILGKRE
jgi:hypothetical protein